MSNHLFDAFRGRISAPERILMATDDGRRILWRHAGALGQLRQCAEASASSRATGSRCRSRRAPRRSCSISPACAPARSTCRSTPPTRRPRSTISSAMPSRALFVCDPARRAALIAPLAARLGAQLRDARRRWRRQRCTDWPRGSPSDFADVGARAGRSRRDPLHLGHDRPLQGRDAHPRQPRLERAALVEPGASPPTTCCSTRCRSSTPTACSSRPTSRLLAGAVDDLPAELRRRPRSLRLLPRATVHDGRADLLHAPAAAATG